MSNIEKALDRELHLARRRQWVAARALAAVARQLMANDLTDDRRAVLIAHAHRWDRHLTRYTNELRGVARIHDAYLRELAKVRANREQVAA